MTVAADRLARAGLCRLGEPDDADLRALLLAFGPEEAWALVRRGDPRVSADLLRRVEGRAEAADPARDLAQASSYGARLVCPGDDEWPDRLADLEPWPPIALWVRGPLHLAEVTQRSVAVVGSRAATTYGTWLAGELGVGLAERSWTVVSGAAYGIDGAAHRGALAAGRPTVAVLACGVDVHYPKGHEQLLGLIAASGLVVSEWPPGCAPMRHRFLTRNRVIAALTGGSVVVEAATRSGALSTMRWAQKLGRVVMATPGPVDSAMSAGCHRFLRDTPEAVLVTTAAEVVEAVGRIGDDLAPRVAGPERAFDTLGRQAARLLDALPHSRWAEVPSLVRTSGLALDDVLRGVAELELAGFAECDAGRWRKTPSGRGA